MIDTANRAEVASNPKMVRAATERTRLAALLRACEPFDGRYVGRLSDKDRETIRDAIETCVGESASNPVWVMPQWVEPPVFGGKKPMIDLAGLRKEIDRLERYIHALDTIDTLPETDEYFTALEAFRLASRKLRDAATAAGVGYPLDALVPVASFSA